jgi:hypothetical protein
LLIDIAPSLLMDKAARMISGESSQRSGDDRAVHAEQDAETRITTEYSTDRPVRTEVPTQQKTELLAESGGTWRAWWSQFKSEFSIAGPTKQVSQIYYIAEL